MALRRSSRALARVLQAEACRAQLGHSQLPAAAVAAIHLRTALPSPGPQLPAWGHPDLWESRLWALEPLNIHAHCVQTDAQGKGEAGALAAASAPGAAATPGASDADPDEKACDDAIGTLQQVKRNYAERRTLPNYRTVGQRVGDVLGAAWGGILLSLRWLVALPSKMLALSRWSRADWSAWWTRVKTVTKEEAHHYWVGRGWVGWRVGLGQRVCKAKYAPGWGRATAGGRRHAGRCTARAAARMLAACVLCRCCNWQLAGHATVACMCAPSLRPITLPLPPLLVMQVGFKLLWMDAKVASGLATKAMRGNELTRWGGRAGPLLCPHHHRST